MEFKNDLGKIIVSENGKEIECEVLFTFECEELGKQYIAFTDYSTDSSGKKNIFVKRFDPITGVDLEDITDQVELDMIEDVIKQVKLSK